MDELRKNISLHCTFCHSTQFAIPYDGYEPHHGSFVVCAQCGRENDFTSLLLVVKSKGIDMAKVYAEKFIEDMKKELIKSFKGSKFIKIK